MPCRDSELSVMITDQHTVKSTMNNMYVACFVVVPASNFGTASLCSNKKALCKEQVRIRVAESVVARTLGSCI